MPDFDFDAFNHDEAYNPEESNDANAAPSQEQPFQANTSEVRVTPPLPINTETSSQETPDDKDPIEITEKKPLEARDTKASEGDNLSGEEVDKW
jgi:hypothetical protein